MPTIEAIKTPILTYHHPEHNNRVDLVGAIHIAEPPYYDAIQTFIDERAEQGAVVHYEMTKVPTPEQLAAAPRVTRRKALRLIKANKELHALLGSIDGLIPQKTGLQYRESWQNHDSTLLEQASGMGNHTVEGAQVALRIMKLASRLAGPEYLQTLMLQQLSDITNDKPHVPGLTERLTTLGRNTHIVDNRNDIAVAAFDAELHKDPTTDLVLLWGLGHLKGLAKAVKSRKFVLTGEQHITAIQAREVPTI